MSPFFVLLLFSLRHASSDFNSKDRSETPRHTNIGRVDRRLSKESAIIPGQLYLMPMSTWPRPRNESRWSTAEQKTDENENGNTYVPSHVVLLISRPSLSSTNADLLVSRRRVSKATFSCHIDHLLFSFFFVFVLSFFFFIGIILLRKKSALGSVIFLICH
ncbi:hypothetical protein BJX61DRAFT_290076 [Aspergillus egyptiacus]|nr:hypothetical protein BJX61DRAFT_290076 [Aspergillus egyptiacus]